MTDVAKLAGDGGGRTVGGRRGRWMEKCTKGTRKEQEGRDVMSSSKGLVSSPYVEGNYILSVTPPPTHTHTHH